MNEVNQNYVNRYKLVHVAKFWVDSDEIFEKKRVFVKNSLLFGKKSLLSGKKKITKNLFCKKSLLFGKRKLPKNF